MASKRTLASFCNKTSDAGPSAAFVPSTSTSELSEADVITKGGQLEVVALSTGPTPSRRQNPIRKRCDW